MGNGSSSCGNFTASCNCDFAPMTGDKYGTKQRCYDHHFRSKCESNGGECYGMYHGGFEALRRDHPIELGVNKSYNSYTDAMSGDMGSNKMDVCVTKDEAIIHGGTITYNKNSSDSWKEARKTQCVGSRYVGTKSVSNPLGQADTYHGIDNVYRVSLDNYSRENPLKITTMLSSLNNSDKPYKHNIMSVVSVNHPIIEPNANYTAHRFHNLNMTTMTDDT